MKRVESLKLSLSKEKDIEILTKSVIEKDEKFLKRHIRDLEDKIEELEEELEDRLRSDAPLDKVALELYRQIINKQVEIEVAEAFRKEYL